MQNTTFPLLQRRIFPQQVIKNTLYIKEDDF